MFSKYILFVALLVTLLTTSVLLAPTGSAGNAPLKPFADPNDAFLWKYPSTSTGRHVFANVGVIQKAINQHPVSACPSGSSPDTFVNASRDWSILFGDNWPGTNLETPQRKWILVHTYCGCGDTFSATSLDYVVQTGVSYLHARGRMWGFDRSYFGSCNIYESTDMFDLIDPYGSQTATLGPQDCPDKGTGSVSGFDSGDGTTDNGECVSATSPITISAPGMSPNIHDWFTDADHGIVSNLFGLGSPMQHAWVRRVNGKAVAGILVMLRSQSDLSIRYNQLFGTNGPQAPAIMMNGKMELYRNGFRTVRWCDLPEDAGNGDGVFGPGDAMYEVARFWFDDNGNGIGDPGEFKTLKELGFDYIYTDYNENSDNSNKTDGKGNVFRYHGSIHKVNGGQQEVWDVIFNAKPAATDTAHNRNNKRKTLSHGE